MNNIANKTSLWNYIEHTSVVIPKLQRDYAQGRKGKENLRENFLSTLRDALDKALQTKGYQLKLDFVYGSSNEDAQFTPLDGQQRLTTLWLMHWYIAFLTNKLNEDNVKDHLGNFTYETRQSSRKFCDRLVKLGHTIKILDKETIADAIMRQSWMVNAWKQDPTIQAMLRMLSGEPNDKIDGLEEMFAETDISILNSYWNLLTEQSDLCPIVFYQLDLDNIGQSDDLYLKMNGRGKPLTDFENFKADLIKFMEDNCWTAFLRPADGIPYLLDSKWMDFFWAYRKETISIDEMILGFINRYFLVILMEQIPVQQLQNCEPGSNLREVYDYLYSFIESESERRQYNDVGFGIYKKFFSIIDDSWSVLYELRIILSNIADFAKNNFKQFIECINNPYYNKTEKDFKFIVTNNVYELTQPQLVAFWAVIYYFRNPNLNDISVLSLRRWMRVVWNICDYNDEIRSKEQIASLISKLSQLNGSNTNARDIHSTLYTTCFDNLLPKGDSDTYVEEHIREERSKVMQMQIGNYDGMISEFRGMTWENVIHEAEHLAYCDGSIRCLIRDSDNHYNWSNFDKRYSHLKWYAEKGMGNLAVRNLLRCYSGGIDLLRYKPWAPNSQPSKRKKYWQTLLCEKNNVDLSSVCLWLNSDCLDNNALSNLPNYPCDELNSLVKTNLLEICLRGKEVHLGWSKSSEKWVLLNHQKSRPYILFDNERDNYLDNFLIRCKSVVKVESDNHLCTGHYDGADICFNYDDGKHLRKFYWRGSLKNGYFMYWNDNEWKFFSRFVADCPYALQKVLGF